MKTELEKVFTDLVLKYCQDTSLAKQIWNEIESNYVQESRHYHTLVHVSSILNELHLHKQNIVDWDTIMFSVFYHDIIYDPLNADNEEKSTELAVERLKEIYFPPGKILICRDQILATKKHETGEHDTAFLVDADLCILGKPWEEYESYSNAIRNEYMGYPDIIYKPGRKNVLMRFLEMKTIFKTEQFRVEYESAARQNIKREIDLIENG